MFQRRVLFSVWSVAALAILVGAAAPAAADDVRVNVVPAVQHVSAGSTGVTVQPVRHFHGGWGGGYGYGGGFGYGGGWGGYGGYYRPYGFGGYSYSPYSYGFAPYNYNYGYAPYYGGYSLGYSPYSYGYSYYPRYSYGGYRPYYGYGLGYW